MKINELIKNELRISANSVGHIGLRSVDPGEKVTLQKLGITSFNMRDIDRFGIIEVTRRMLAKIAPTRDRSLFISLDIDVMDDLENSKNTGTPGNLVF
jgi:arginase